MNKILCKRLEIIEHCYAEIIFKDYCRLKHNYSFMDLPLENIQYSCQRQPKDAGTVLVETVTAKIRIKDELTLLNSPVNHYVLRLHSDNNTFYVGTHEYPALLTYNSDNIHVNLTFKVTKPV